MANPIGVPYEIRLHFDNPAVIKLTLNQKEKCLFELQRLFDSLFSGIPLTEEHMSKVAMRFYCFFQCNGLSYLIPDIWLYTTITEKSVRYKLYNERDNKFVFTTDDYRKIENRLLVDIFKQSSSLYA